MSSRYLRVLLLGAVLFAATVLSDGHHPFEKEHKHCHKHHPGSRRLLETVEVEDSHHCRRHHHHHHHPHEHILVEEVEKENSHKKPSLARNRPTTTTTTTPATCLLRKWQPMKKKKSTSTTNSTTPVIAVSWRPFKVKDLHHHHGHMLAEEVAADEKNKLFPERKPQKKGEEPKEGKGEKPHHRKQPYKPPTEN